MEKKTEPVPAGNATPLWVKCFLGCVFAAALVMALRALGIMTDFNALAYRLSAAGWDHFAAVILRNKVAALWHAAFMTVCAALFIWLFCARRIRNKYALHAALWLLVTIVAVDAFYLSRHYVKTMPLKAFEENDVIRLLKTLPENRTACVTQDGFYNLWLTYLFPYHGVKTINVTQMPRMSDDYKRFFEAVGRNPLRLWRLSAVGFVLAPAQFWGQVQNDPAMKDIFELVYAYNVRPLPAGRQRGQASAGVEVVPATAEQPGQHVVMRFKEPAPRFALIGCWEIVADAEALRRIGLEKHQLSRKVMIAPECVSGLPDASGAGEDGQAQMLEYRPGRIKLKTSSVTPAILRVSEKYDPDWRVRIDGKEGKILRADFIFQGVYVEPGVHEVLLEYAPPKWPLCVQGLGLLAFAAAVCVLILRRKRWFSVLP
ncbi:MAG: hypothetical protein PHP98_04115 [Kiritimatiellae bacterium]|nr:hypothetical protein [Kiritimatiellia bacterium]